MPTYEFRCPNGHEFEKFYRTITASEMDLPCPECGLTAHRRMSVGAGLVFKGSGFYLTDYGKNAHATRGGTKPSAPEAEGAKPASGESAPKPAPGGASTPATPAPAPAADKGSAAPGAAKRPPKRDG